MTEVARQLRLVRDRAGLTYAQLSCETGLNQTSLYRAANGWRTAWPVVEAFVRGCGADPALVREHWQAATAPGGSFGVSQISDLATFPQILEAMNTLRRTRSLSLRGLSAAAEAWPLPKSTLSAVLRGRMPLRKDFLRAFVQAAGVGPEQEAAWIAAWERASRASTSHPQPIYIVTPSHALLSTLSDLPLADWSCLAEFVDDALGRQAHTSDLGAGPVPPVELSMSLNVDAEGGIESIVVRDEGPGMNDTELIGAVRAGGVRRGSARHSNIGLGLAGLRLGSVVTVRTARREAAAWSVVVLDLRVLAGDSSWSVSVVHEPKQRQDEHGTEIIIRELRDVGRRLRPQRLRQKLGDVYDHLIREDSLRMIVDGRLVAARMPCAWGSGRTVQVREGTIAARQNIDVTLSTALQCRDCSYYGSWDADACSECGSRHLVPVPERVWGWLGVQRYLHSTDYGIDFYRFGRKISARDKSMFSWSDDDSDEALLEYPVDGPGHQGRIIGEIHCDHVPVTWSKDAFATDTAQWRAVRRVLRGSGPLGTQRSRSLGYPVNDSPLAALFRGFRRCDPGLRFLVPGNGRQAIHEEARCWGRAFRQGDPGFQSDERWYEAASQHDMMRQSRPVVAKSFGDLLGQSDTSADQRTGDAAGKHASVRTPQAEVQCVYVSERKVQVTKKGTLRYGAADHRLRVRNTGTAPAERLRITVQQVGEGGPPRFPGAAGQPHEETVERLLDRTHLDLPLALPPDTPPKALITLRWEENGEAFKTVGFINWEEDPSE
ncbi:helix-turn-helix domain-containing protein [Streptomyces hydrogenans]|uniref:helix-turn-helix domain-containing protein n=1 Tax=Streptomyces hydrogenans TaxID=1873719 RepID=UPI0038044A1A